MTHDTIDANCRRRITSGAKDGARPGGRGMSSSGARSGATSCALIPTSRKELSSSARRCSAGMSAPPRRWRPDSAIGCSGVFCNSCEALHSTQVCGVPASLAWSSSMSLDLPRPGSPTTNTNWPSPARARSHRRTNNSNSSSRPTNGVSARAPLRRLAPLARAMRKSLTGSFMPLSSQAPCSSATKSPATWR